MKVHFCFLLSLMLLGTASFASETRDTRILVDQDGLRIEVVGSSAAQLMDYLSLTKKRTSRGYVKSGSFAYGDSQFTVSCLDPSGREDTSCQLSYSAQGAKFFDYTGSQAHGLGVLHEIDSEFGAVWNAPSETIMHPPVDSLSEPTFENRRMWQSNDGQASLFCSTGAIVGCGLNLKLQEFPASAVSFADETGDTRTLVDQDGLRIEVAGEAAAHLMDYLNLPKKRTSRGYVKSGRFEFQGNLFTVSCLDPSSGDTSCQLSYSGGMSFFGYTGCGGAALEIDEVGPYNRPSSGFTAIWNAPAETIEIPPADSASEPSTYVHRSWHSNDGRVSLVCGKHQISPASGCGFNLRLSDFPTSVVEF